MVPDVGAVTRQRGGELAFMCEWRLETNAQIADDRVGKERRAQDEKPCGRGAASTGRDGRAAVKLGQLLFLSVSRPTLRPRFYHESHRR
jgi:hypothetical protein